MRPEFSTSMKTAFIAVMVIVSAGLASAQGTFRGYELTVSWGSSASRITSSHEVALGQTVQVDVGEEIIMVSLQSVSDQEYDLQISVTPSTGTNLTSASAPQVRKGSFGTPIELTNAANARLSSGAFVLVHKIWE